MIAIVQLRVMDDAMVAATMQAERCDLVVNVEGDGEGNLLKARARLDDLVRDALASIDEQVRQLRDEEGPAAPVRPLPRRGR